MINRTFKIACMLLGMSTCTIAQERWGLQDCIDYALKNNIQIQTLKYLNVPHKYFQ